MRYTPEYYAYKHFSHFVAKGTEMLAYAGRDYSKSPVLVFKTPEGKYVVTAANFTDGDTNLSVKINNKYLNINLQPHSFCTYVI